MKPAVINFSDNFYTLNSNINMDGKNECLLDKNSLKYIILK